MSFITRNALQAYIDQYIISNGTNSITGSELNTALTGLLDFIPSGNTAQSTMGTLAITGITSGSTHITIPLTFTPTITFVQVQSTNSADIVTGSMPNGNSIEAYMVPNVSRSPTVLFSYLAL